ncbi:PD40 domain-containing protein [bacterium]|nr:PD40 domain-containing protein [bacterium]
MREEGLPLAGSRPAPVRVADMLPLIWLAGALVLGAYVFASNFNLWRIVKRERPSTDQKTLDLLEDCKGEMGIRTIVGLVITDKVRSPALFGFVRPRLLLPKQMIEALSQQELRYVFLHELGHLKRFDIYQGWLMSLLQVLHWFNPLVWVAFYRMRSDRELACDALVLSRTESREPQAYGRTIVDLLDRFSRAQRLPGMAGILETKSQLKRRITMIARFKKKSYRWSPLGLILLVVLGCVSLCNAKGGKSPDVAAAKPSPGMTLREVKMESGDYMSLSPDGKYMCDVDWDTGNLVLRELATGNERPLTGKASWEESGDFAEDSAISRDSKRVAFLWWNSERGAYDLRIVGLDGPGNRVVRQLEKKEWFQPAAWSADGKRVLGTFAVKDKPRQIVWVSTEDGSMRVVKTFDDGEPGRVDLSPDGRYIAYELPQEKGASKRDIFAFAIEDNREIPLVQHPADDKLMGWTPDGRRIFFTSDRMESWDGWVLQVARGEPSGLPESVKAPMGDASPIGFTRGGSFYYALGHRSYGVYLAALDLETGKVLSSPKPVGYTGTEGAPDWSPDGKYLAYCTRPRDSKSQIIHIRSVKTGQERELDGKLPHFNGLRWSPDSRFLLASGFGKESPQVVYKTDAQTGDRTVLLRSEKGRIGPAELSPDGKRLFYTRLDGASQTRSLVVRELETGREKELLGTGIGGETVFPFWDLSPDGQNLAFCMREDKTDRPWAIKIMPAEGGERKTLIRGLSPIAWTPDGQDVLFTKQDDNTLTLWRISAEGGEPRKLWAWKKRPWVVGTRVHPDGRNLTFQVIERRTEVWVMENFLPRQGGVEESAATK